MTEKSTMNHYCLLGDNITSYTHETVGMYNIVMWVRPLSKWVTFVETPYDLSTHKHRAVDKASIYFESFLAENTLNKHLQNDGMNDVMNIGKAFYTILDIRIQQK